MFFERDGVQLELNSLSRRRYQKRGFSRETAGGLKRDDRYGEHRFVELERFLESYLSSD